MFQTMNDLPEASRKGVVDLLQNGIADGIQLSQFAKQAHWTVKGPNFFGLHELFDKIHEEMEAVVDLMAERIAQLGGYPEGTCKAAQKMTSLSDYPAGIVDESEHLQTLAVACAEFGEAARASIEKSVVLRDLVSADLFTEAARMLDKTLWILESQFVRPEMVRKPGEKSPFDRGLQTKSRKSDAQPRM